MKNTFLFFGIILLFSFAEKKGNIQEVSPAAKEVYAKIIYLEKEVEKFKQGNAADFNSAMEIVQLSKIEPEEWYNDIGGVHLIPKKRDIRLWKRWFEKNKMSFSYDGEIDFDGKRNIIKVEYEIGKFRRNFSAYEINNHKVKN